MDVSFPNSATVIAPEGFLLWGGRWNMISLPIRYGRFDHPAGGKCLVDTGYSERVTKGDRSLPLRMYAAILRPRLTSDILPRARPHVDTILVTHLHADHVSALRDYPAARIFIDRQSLKTFLQGSAFRRVRHGLFKELLPENLLERCVDYSDCAQVNAPMGLGLAADVFGDGSVLAVPLPGHMKGHTGILWTARPVPLLYAADAEWLYEAIRSGRSPGYPARAILDDVAAARDTADRIRTFVASGGEVVLCHDPETLP